MGKYTINYNTGIKEEVEAETLEEVKKSAEEGIAYTQEKVTIEDSEGEVITTARWIGVAPEEDDFVLADFDKYGYYQTWEDELA